MSEIMEFLLVRIAEDEAAATALRGCDGVLGAIAAAPCEEGRDYILRFQPGRILDEIRAKHRIVESAISAQRSVERRRGPATDAVNGHVIAFREVVRHLARPYADHPDFRQEWLA